MNNSIKLYLVTKGIDVKAFESYLVHPMRLYEKDWETYIKFSSIRTKFNL